MCKIHVHLKFHPPQTKTRSTLHCVWHKNIQVETITFTYKHNCFSDGNFYCKPHISATTISMAYSPRLSCLKKVTFGLKN